MFIRRAGKTSGSATNCYSIPPVEIDHYTDSFGNEASRFVIPRGKIRLHNSTLIEDSGEPDWHDPKAQEVPVGRLLYDTLRYLLPSR